ncbi:MAG TPA: peptidoglycan DD-metalloendopeptidase family protein, partial [Polyangiaceae bacterium]
MNVRARHGVFWLLCVGSASALTSSSPPTAAINAGVKTPPEIGDVEHRLADVTRDERVAKSELEQLGKDAAEAEWRTLARGRAYVRLARAGLLPVGGGFDALLEHAVRIERLRRGLQRDVTLERELATRRIALAKKLGDLSARRSALETEQESLNQARVALLSEQDRKDAFERAFSSAGSAHMAVYSGGLGPADLSAAGFAALKGKLPFPLSGRSEIRHARRAGSEGPGLEMIAPRGATVRSVYAGRVAFADSYADYGRTVILDHGDGYYTVCANLDT